MPEIYDESGKLRDINEDEEYVEPEGNDDEEEIENDGAQPEEQENDFEAEESEEDDDSDEEEDQESVNDDPEFPGMSEDDIEREARMQGWVPPDEYRGDKSRAVDAKEFLRRGKEILPIVNKQLGEYKERLARAEEELTNINRMNRQAMKRQAEKLLAEVEDRRKQAREENDWDTFDEADEELSKVKENLKELEEDDKEEEKTPKTPDIEELKKVPSVKEFLDRNPWYDTNEDMTREADYQGIVIRQQNPDMSDVQYFKVLEERMRKLYPEEFGTPQRKRKGSAASSQGRGSERRRPGDSPSKKTFNDLPKEAKQAFKEQYEEGLWENKEEYVELYFANEE